MDDYKQTYLDRIPSILGFCTIKPTLGSKVSFEIGTRGHPDSRPVVTCPLKAWMDGFCMDSAWILHDDKTIDSIEDMKDGF